MGANSYSDIKSSRHQLYLEDPRPWLVGFSGGKDSTMLASLIVELAAGIPDHQRGGNLTSDPTRGHVAAEMTNGQSRPAKGSRGQKTAQGWRRRGF